MILEFMNRMMFWPPFPNPKKKNLSGSTSILCKEINASALVVYLVNIEVVILLLFLFNNFAVELLCFDSFKATLTYQCHWVWFRENE